MKPYSFQNPTDQDAIAFNQRHLKDATRFGVWTPTCYNVSNLSATNSKAYFALDGPLCTYYILLAWDGVGAGLITGAGGNQSYVSNCPYGPNSRSGLKSSYDTQFLQATNLANYQDLIASMQAAIIFSGGLPRLLIPYTGGAGGTTSNSVVIHGTFFRE